MAQDIFDKVQPDEDIFDKVARNTGNYQKISPFPLQPQLPSAGIRYAGSLYDAGKGAVTSLLHPIDTARQMFITGPRNATEKAIAAPSLLERFGHGLASITGPIGQMAEGIGEQAGSGDIAGAAGSATALAAPELLRGVPRLGRAVNDVAQTGAERLYESALKPAPRSNTAAEVKSMVQTGLKEGIPVSEPGLSKLEQLQQDMNRRVASSINNSALPINKFDVARRLSDKVAEFRNQANPEADLQTLSDTGNEFLRNQPNEILPTDAQALKVGTYRQLKNRAFGELKGAAVEGQKTLARGLKEEIEARFPNVKDLNQRSANLFNLEPDLQAAVNRSANHNIFGITSPLIGAGVDLATGSHPLGIAAMLAKEVMSRPVNKSRMAIALSRMSGH